MKEISEGMKKDLEEVLGQIYLTDEEFEQFRQIERVYVEASKTIRELTLMKGNISKDIMEQQGDELDKAIRYYDECNRTIQDIIMLRAKTSANLHDLWVIFRNKYGLDDKKNYSISTLNKQITECDHNFDQNRG